MALITQLGSANDLKNRICECYICYETKVCIIFPVTFVE